MSPENKIRELRMRLLQTEEKLQHLMEAQILQNRHKLGLYIERMKGLSPLNKLNQGFSYVENEQQKAVTSVKQVQEGGLLCIHVKDGRIYTRAEKLEEGALEWEEDKT